jgi:hypothetical protein
MKRNEFVSTPRAISELPACSGQNTNKASELTDTKAVFVPDKAVI